MTNAKRRIVVINVPPGYDDVSRRRLANRMRATVQDLSRDPDGHERAFLYLLSMSRVLTLQGLEQFNATARFIV